MKRSISSFYWGKIGFQWILFEIRLFCCVISLITWRQRKLLKPSLPKMVRSFSSLTAGSSIQSYLINNTHYQLKPHIWLSRPCRAVMCSVLAKYPALLWCQGVGEPVQLTDGPGHWVSRQFKGQHIYQLFMSVLTNSINHNISSTQALSPNIQWMVISLSRVTIHLWAFLRKLSQLKLWHRNVVTR